MKSFRDKEVLITGAASGIGRSSALRFAAQGAKLWLVDRDAEGLEAVACEVHARGGVARSQACDVASEAQMAELASRVHGEVEALDVLMNNAGIAVGGRFLESKLETFRKAIDINLMGVVYGCHAFLPRMVERGQGGHVVNTASAAAFVASPEMPAYCASKFAVRGFTEALRADMHGHGIGVTVVCPGVINTPIVATAIFEGKLGEAGRQKRIVDLYDWRNYSPDRVAEAVLEGVRDNIGVLPVSPEAWGLYYGKRFAPKLMERVISAKVPLVKY